MKHLLLTSAFLIGNFITFSQKKSTFLVEFFYEQRSTVIPDSVLNKKIEGEVLYPDSKTPDKVATTLADLMSGDMGFVASVFMIANSDSSKTYFPQSEQSDGPIKMTVNTPDTLYYKKGKWTKLSDGEFEIVPAISISVVETKERKIFLGYECIKFISTDYSKNEGYVFWACKDLPNTLLPFTGLTKFAYGILEIFGIKDNWHTVPRDVTILSPKKAQL